MYRHTILIFSFFVAYCSVKAQSDEKRLKKDLQYLASDRLQGRYTGSKYEKKASDYIIKAFQEAGLSPKGVNNDWLQPFVFQGAYYYGKENRLSINGIKLKLEKEYYPLAYSSDGVIEGEGISVGFGIESIEKKHNDYEKLNKQELAGKIFFINLDLPDGAHPHHALIDYKGWKSRLDFAKKYHPKAIIFYGSDVNISMATYKQFNNLNRDSILLVHITDSIAKLILKGGKDIQIKTSVDIKRNPITGNNVIGFVDNKARNTIVIGAHYDHLGKTSGDHHSLYRGKPAIHNGADDNASGTAVMIELARLLSKKQNPKSNYLFMAFSGEELGLLGSSYFIKNPTIDINSISCMINMDMVGRMDETKRELGINGVGTSPVWDSLIKHIPNNNFKIKTTQSGMGPSDQTSFYLKDKPAIHFFSGMHPDYHKPTDDADKINYKGMTEISNYIYQFAIALDRLPSVPFVKTKTDSSQPVPNYKVTLGIIPDYFHEGKGVRVDGTSKGKTAEKAGILSGDVILKMGENEIGDMNAYMKALSKFKKGEETEVLLDRKGEKIVLKVTF